eukprot:m.35315 g.35315  ORF g.35315 m.35315 type:complete len:135 (+) comp17114_c1_seq1:81-485(+)
MMLLRSVAVLALVSIVVGQTRTIAKKVMEYSGDEMLDTFVTVAYANDASNSGNVVWWDETEKILLGTGKWQTQTGPPLTSVGTLRGACLKASPFSVTCDCNFISLVEQQTTLIVCSGDNGGGVHSANYSFSSGN